MRPSGHCVLITGGGTGIGYAIARKFIQHGNRVIIVGRSGESLNRAIDDLPGLEACVADVTISSDRERLVEAYPDTTVLVNSAGILNNTALSESTPQDIEEEMAVNLLSPILLSRLFLPNLLTASSAAIVYMSSNLAVVPKECAAVYSASKAALHNFSKAFRWQLEGTNISVFEVVPSLVDTPMTAGFRKRKMPPAQFAELFWIGFKEDKYEMPIGNAKILSVINRIAPSVAERIMRKTE